MICNRLPLRDLSPLASKDSRLDSYLYSPEDGYPFSKRPAVLIIPGGGYFSLAPLEGENVAMRYYSEGFNAFVLHYALHERYPAPHLDLALAVAYIRSHAEAFALDGTLALIGFSAGGHLAATYPYLTGELSAKAGLDEKTLQIDGLILGYPVISMLEDAHLATRDNIAGDDPKLRELLSADLHVSPAYPPTFLFVLPDDRGVSPSHSLRLYRALQENNVPRDAYFAPGLDHGQSILTIENKRALSPLNEREAFAKGWVDSSIEFLLNAKRDA